MPMRVFMRRVLSWPERRCLGLAILQIPPDRFVECAEAFTGDRGNPQERKVVRSDVRFE